jgi:hypothetical protein
MKIYDMKQYSDQMLYLNEVDRLKIYSYKEADKMKYHLLGYDGAQDNFPSGMPLGICDGTATYLRYHDALLIFLVCCTSPLRHLPGTR